MEAFWANVAAARHAAAEAMTANVLMVLMVIDSISPFGMAMLNLLRLRHLVVARHDEDVGRKGGATKANQERGLSGRRDRRETASSRAALSD